MARTKLTVRRWATDVTRMAKGQRTKRIYPFKVKLPLPQQKTVKYKKEWTNY